MRENQPRSKGSSAPYLEPDQSTRRTNSKSRCRTDIEPRIWKSIEASSCAGIVRIESNSDLGFPNFPSAAREDQRLLGYRSVHSKILENRRESRARPAAGRNVDVFAPIDSKFNFASVHKKSQRNQQTRFSSPSQTPIMKNESKSMGSYGGSPSMDVLLAFPLRSTERGSYSPFLERQPVTADCDRSQSKDPWLSNVLPI